MCFIVQLLSYKMTREWIFLFIPVQGVLQVKKGVKVFLKEEGRKSNEKTNKGW